MEPLKTKKILLTRKWSGHEAGEIVEEWEVTVDSMIRKGYGQEYKPKPPRPETSTNKGPEVETMVTEPPAETAEVRPRRRRRGRPRKQESEGQ